MREAIGNNVPGQQVSVTVGGATRTATTDAQGRAEFTDLPNGGTNAVAEVTVDGEKLVSQPFTVPTSGGLRVILVAGIAKAAERKKQEEAAAAAEPPTKGIVVLGGNSRVLMQFNNDALDVYFDQSHFIRSFRRFTGFSPAAFADLDNEFGRIFYKGSSQTYNPRRR